MPPMGRSVALEMTPFCDCYADVKLNKRHLWSEHDETRWYSDPYGWNAHADNCEQCNPIPVADEGGV